MSSSENVDEITFVCQVKQGLHWTDEVIRYRCPRCLTAMPWRCMGEWRWICMHPKPWHWTVVSFMHHLLYCQEKCRYPPDRESGGPQGPYWHGGKVKIPAPAEIQISLIQPIACQYTSWILHWTRRNLNYIYLTKFIEDPPHQISNVI
jgi:hypothetical protein